MVALWSASWSLWNWEDLSKSRVFHHIPGVCHVNASSFINCISSMIFLSSFVRVRNIYWWGCNVQFHSQLPSKWSCPYLHAVIQIQIYKCHLNSCHNHAWQWPSPTRISNHLPLIFNSITIAGIHYHHFLTHHWLELDDTFLLAAWVAVWKTLTHWSESPIDTFKT